ncbi:hypothetical protein [Pseudomonas sp. GL-B-16]|uniref:hypothetical protein n=1 Tax=Pseudomonas sp. GL-B-16 TaxID=2832373 RepID=UPI001CBBD695|nr:hypothetical protein [Pseudomonas sp. GL-B-16]
MNNKLRTLTSLIITLSLVGCSNESKMEAVCKDISKRISTDPSTFRVNEVRTTSAKMTSADVLSFLQTKYPNGIPDATNKLREMLASEKDEKSSQTFVTVDFSAQSDKGAKRNEVLCHYVNWTGTTTSLNSITANNRDYTDLLGVFLRFGKPDGLNLQNNIE